MLRNKEDLTKDRDSSGQQLDFTKKISKEKSVEKSRKLVGTMLLLTAGLSFSFWIARFLTARLKQGSLTSLVPGTKLTFSLPSLSNQIPLPQRDPDLNPVFQTLFGNKQGNWSAYVHLLDQESSPWSKDADLPLTAASLIKLPAVLTYYREVDLGNLDPNTEYELIRQDLRSGAGTLQHEELGYTTTYQNLASLAFNKSDNTAYSALLRILTPDLINQFISSLDLSATNLEENTTSARDMGKIFEYIYLSPSISSTVQEQILTSLTNTSFEDRLPAGLPQGIHIAHKVGTETNSISDAGIVFTPDKNFIIVLIADNVSPQKAEATFSQFSQEVYWELLNH